MKRSDDTLADAYAKRWTELLTSIRSPRSEWHRLVPFVEWVASTPYASQFFYFDSVGTLHFARCSSFPFDASGLPGVAVRTAEHPQHHAPSAWTVFLPDGTERPCEDIDHVIALIDSILRDAEPTTWLGNNATPLFHDLSEGLAAHHAGIELEFQGWSLFVAGSDVFVTPDRSRYCTLHPPNAPPIECATRKDAVEAIVAWVEADG